MRRVRGVASFFVLLATFAASILVASEQAIARTLPGAPGAAGASTRQALLAAVCDGGVQGKTCRECPSFTSEVADNRAVIVGPFLTGSFVNAGASEAYVGLTGCDSKPAGYTGGVLLRQMKGKWKVIRYDSGSDARACLRYAYVTGKTLLVCYFTGEPGGRGVVGEGILVLSPGPKDTAQTSLLTVRDNTGGCYDSKDKVAFEAWAKEDANSDKRADLVLTVSESHGSADAVTCEAGPPGEVLRHRIPFLFDGKRFKVSSEAAATVACLDSSTSGEGPKSYCPTIKP